MLASGKFGRISSIQIVTRQPHLNSVQGRRRQSDIVSRAVEPDGKVFLIQYERKGELDPLQGRTSAAIRALESTYSKFKRSVKINISLSLPP